MSDVKLAYGIKDGKVIHISELGTDQTGNNCNCVCPSCGGALCARQGKFKRHHFSHQANQSCDINVAHQSALHLLAKEIIAENREILIPGWEVQLREIISADMNYLTATNIKSNLPKWSAVKMTYDKVELEKEIVDIIADAVISKSNNFCIVEIAVTHFVDEEKVARSKKIGIPMIEIDLSSFIHNPQDREAVTRAVLDNVSNRKWIVNGKRDSAIAEAKRELIKQYADVIAQQHKHEQKRQNAVARLRRDFEPENYRNILLAMRNDKAAFEWLKKYGAFDQFQYYTDIPITGEFVFSCDRRIWQSNIFQTFIIRGFNQEITEFTVSQIKDYIFNEKLKYQGISFNKNRVYGATVIINGREKKVSLAFDVIKTYLEYLCILGFATATLSCNHYYAKRPKSLDAPKQEAASVLKEAINSVDPYAPNVDELIHCFLEDYGIDRKRLSEIAP